MNFSRWRIVADFRMLNFQTIPDTYSLPLIEETLSKLRGAKYFSKIDLTEGYWNFMLDKESQTYTGFELNEKSYVWRRMSIGLVNFRATMQKYMTNVLDDLKDICQWYIDDVIIFSKTFEEHCKHIEMVLAKLREKGFGGASTKAQLI